MKHITRAIRAFRAASYARARGIPGIEFDQFGRTLGLGLLLRGHWAGLNYLLNPVSIVRYFEFPCVLSFLPHAPAKCLDISSPRLFSLFVAQRYSSASILMLNPDREDITETASLIQKNRITNIRTQCAGVDFLEQHGMAYDCIWSISVIEHISGATDDQQALKLMFGALNVGGRLILTVPVDRRYWVEYRDRPYYGTVSIPDASGRFFFQRHYDAKAIQRRLGDVIAREPRGIRWFGEKSPGRYSRYEERWMREGLDCTVNDPREIADNFREFAAWDEMPGTGVCCLMFEK